MTEEATALSDEELVELRCSSWPIDSNPHRIVDRLLATIDTMRAERDEDIVAVAAEMAADIDTDAQQRAVGYEKEKWTAENERDKMRAALIQAMHDLGCLAAALQLAAPNDPMVPFGYRMMEAARAALVP